MASSQPELAALRIDLAKRELAVKEEAFAVKQQLFEVVAREREAALKAKEDQFALKEEQFALKEKQFAFQEDVFETALKAKEEQFALKERTFDSLGLGYNPHSMFNLDDGFTIIGDEEQEQQVHHLISVAQQQLDLRGKQLRAVSEQVMGQYDNTVKTKRENAILIKANNQLTEDNVALMKSVDELKVEVQDFMDTNARLRMENTALVGSLDKLKNEHQDLVVDTNSSQMASDIKLKDEHDNLLSRLECIKLLGSADFKGQSILTIPVDEFNERYKPRIKVAQMVKLSAPKTFEKLFTQSNSDFYNSGQYTKYLRLVVKQPPQVTQLTNQQIIDKIITPCNTNSKHYGKSKDKISIQFRVPQLDRQVHIQYTHYSSLIDTLYLNTDAQDNLKSKNRCVNPYDTSNYVGTSPLFNWFMNPDYANGKIPKLTPELKLFFSTPNIASGDWIQFHGPGTQLYCSGLGDSKFVVYIGSFCDPNKKSQFTGLESYTDGDDKWIEHISTSDYSIVIRWE